MSPVSNSIGRTWDVSGDRAVCVIVCYLRGAQGAEHHNGTSLMTRRVSSSGFFISCCHGNTVWYIGSRHGVAIEKLWVDCLLDSEHFAQQDRDHSVPVSGSH